VGRHENNNKNNFISRRQVSAVFGWFVDQVLKINGLIIIYTDHLISFIICVIRFLIQATQVLDKHIDIEGLFRKSGSVARQKELKVNC